MKNREIVNVQLILMILCLLCLESLNGQDAPLNHIDTLGYKQGQWVEFEARPKEISYTINDDLINDEASVEFEYDYDDLEIYKLIGNYSDGLKIGVWKLFDSQGDLKCSFTLEEGIIIGPFEFYYKNGKIRIKGYLQTGEKFSRVENYAIDGKFEKENYLETKYLVRTIIK